MAFKNKSNSGYTLDQTILVVGIIAVLCVLIIISIGWSLLNKTEATKGIGLLKQIESANNKFYAIHQYWPEEAIMAANDSSWPSGAAAREQAIHVLVDPRYIDNGSNAAVSANLVENHQNLINGLRDDAGNGYLTHDFGEDGRIEQRMLTLTSGHPIGTFDAGTYHVVRLLNVPYDIAVEMDEKMDGKRGFDEGRLVVRASGDLGLPRNCRSAPAAPTSGYVSVCYIANLSQ